MQLQKGFGPIVSHAMLKLVDKRKKESLSNGDLKARVVVLLQTIVLSSLLPKVTLLTRILLLSYFLFFFSYVFLQPQRISTPILHSSQQN